MAMENFKGIKILNPHRSPGSCELPNPHDILKKGELIKEKNMKKRYFVLRKDKPPRLEYYESERRFREGFPPRKIYELDKCYTISKMVSKRNHVFGLFVNSECVTLIAESHELMQEWIIKLQQQKQSAPGSTSFVEHKHTWHVEILPKGLATSNGLVGPHVVGLNNESLTLIRSDNEYTSRKEFRLDTIRQCGHINEFFYIDLGRASCIKAGELWMRALDNFIATNMHNIVGSTMNQNNYENHRERTKSVCNPRSESELVSGCVTRPRADSTPSRSRTTSESPRFPASPTSPIEPFLHWPGHVNSISESGEISRGENSSRQTPDRDANQFDDGCVYIDMTPGTNLNASAKIPSREGFRGPDSLTSPPFSNAEGDMGEYIDPSLLAGFARRCSHGAAISSETCSQSGCSNACTPVSPLAVGSIGGWRPSANYTQLPSPQASSESHSAAHSRSSSLLDDICDESIPLQPVASRAVSAAPGASVSNPYLEMGPGIDVEGGKRVSSNPTPIPHSPHDANAFHELSMNSGNSSLTSGTDSSDLPLNELGTPSSTGSTLGQAFGIGDPDDPQMRPIRTNSVGSKPEQCKRKNRLDAVSFSEPVRARAFSVGSRVSLKFGGGGGGKLAAPVGGGQGAGDPPGSTGCPGEMFPSIKESGKQVKSKSSSAPMLVGSPVSHSWSGTPGCHFRNVSQSKASSRDSNHLLLDYSGNKSFDNISEVKDKKSFWPFSHRRQHSTSKSEVTREKKFSESDASHRPIDIPLSSHKDYCKVDFSGNSPWNVLLDTSSSYLPMHPPHSSLSGSSSALRMIPPHHDQQWDMSSSLSSCGSQDGYVDMTQGSSPGSLVLASSSSSSTSLNVLGTRHRRTGIVVNPLSSVDLPSPLEEAALTDLKVLNSELDLDANKKKMSKKRPSLRRSTKKKKSDACAPSGKDGESESGKSKSPGHMLSLANLLSRKSSNTKFPLSPQGNSKMNPFSAFGQGKGKELKDVSSSPPQQPSALDKDLDEEGKCAITPTETNFPKGNTPHAMASNPSSTSLEKIFEAASKSEVVLEKPQGSAAAAAGQSSIQFSAAEKRASLCEMVSKGLTLEVEETVAAVRSPSPSAQRTSLAVVKEDREYVNMNPGSPNPLPLEAESPPPSESPSPKSQPLPALSLKIQPQQPSSGDPFSGAKDKLSMRSALEGPLSPSHHELKSASDLDILMGPEQSHVTTNIERSRSHSGPGASVNASYERKSERGHGGDGRAASACSSPISSSPPTSPTLGSVSSMSSLSEGGLSSASSTCTVVNVGMTRVPSLHNNNSSSSNQPAAQPKVGKPFVPSQSDHTHEQSGAGVLLSKDSQVSPSRCQTSPSAATDSRSSSSLNRQSYSGSKSSLNYASLDLGSCKAGENSPKSRRKSSSPVTDESSLGYSQIDFTKSEGLRNTFLERDSNRH